MCDACEDWEGREPRRAGPPVARRAREIERAMPGERVADAAWRIALGEESGALGWSDHLRIATALQAATAEHGRMAAFARRRQPRRLACDAAR